MLELYGEEHRDNGDSGDPEIAQDDYDLPPPPDPEIHYETRTREQYLAEIRSEDHPDPGTGQLTDG